jgi:hypothetical protein
MQPPHTPPLHVRPEQQFAVPLQLAPLPPHVGWQVPPVQAKPEQHSLLDAQLAPVV